MYLSHTPAHLHTLHTYTTLHIHTLLHTYTLLQTYTRTVNEHSCAHIYSSTILISYVVAVSPVQLDVKSPIINIGLMQPDLYRCPRPR